MKHVLRLIRVRLLAASVLAMTLVGDLMVRFRGARSGSVRGDILLIGAYGNGNYGDDAIGIAVIESLCDITAGDVRVLGRRPDDKRIRRESDAEFVVGGDGCDGLYHSFRASKGVSAAVLGGGGLLEGRHDNVHVHRLVLEYVGKLAAARLRGIPAYAHGIGVSPAMYSSRFVSFAIARSLRSLDGISVRDRASQSVLCSLGIEAQLVYDPAFHLLGEWAGEAKLRSGTVAFVGLDHHRWPDFAPGEDATEAARGSELGGLVHLLRGKSAGADVLEMHPFHFSDVGLLRDLADRYRSAAPGTPRVEIAGYPTTTAKNAFVRLMSCERIVTMRFHPALAGLAVGRDVEIIGDLEKLAALRRIVGEGGAATFPRDFLDPLDTLRTWLDGGTRTER